MTCEAVNCDRPARRAGLCSTHHSRKLRHGDMRAYKAARRWVDVP